MIIICQIDWTAASAIASFLMIFVTALSILISIKQNKRIRESNHAENEQNRKIQIRILKYENQVSWINLLRDAIGYAQECLSFAVQDKYRQIKNSNEKSCGNLTNELFENGNKVKRKFVALLYGRGSYEEEFLNFIDNFCKRYWCYIFDLDFLYSLGDSINQESMKSKVDEYKTRHNSLSYANKRIWYIIEQQTYGTNTEDFTHYINEICKRYEFEAFENRCLELLRYELNQADIILNGTEQNK